jgi:hypothetical protein
MELKQIPAAKQFVEENVDFLSVLLDVSVKIQIFEEDFNSTTHKQSVFYFDIYYSDENQDLNIRADVVDKESRVEILTDKDLMRSMNALLVEYERDLIAETMSTKLNSQKGKYQREPFVHIQADHVNIEYHYSRSAHLAIWSPPIEIEETCDYRMYKYGIKINDNWGVYLRTDGFRN